MFWVHVIDKNFYFFLDLKKKQTYKTAIKTSTYFLAKYLNPILSLFTANDYTVKNFSDCAEDVISYDHNLSMASLNV